MDADWPGCPDSRKSTTGYVLLFNGAVIAWKSKRQNVVALSSAEAEFMAASSLVQEVIYIRRLLDRLGFPQNNPTLLLEKTTVLELLGEKELLEGVIELNILTYVGILCMTQSKTGY